ncbi:MAG: hypothetical protein LC624_05280 [Halobacteriales archaeon]|nr:hypothetical protein [Halobacteriales archaeon]
MTEGEARVPPSVVLLPIFGGFIGGAIAAAQVWPRSKGLALGLFALGLVTTGLFLLLLDDPTFSRVADRGF